MENEHRRLSSILRTISSISLGIIPKSAKPGRSPEAPIALRYQCQKWARVETGSTPRIQQTRVAQPVDDGRVLQESRISDREVGSPASSGTFDFQNLAWRLPALALSLCTCGCSGVQSALDPAGEEAHEVARLFWVMVGAGGAIWLGVASLLVYASRKRGQALGEDGAGRLIFWCGAAMPSLLLFFLLGYALWLMPGLRPFARAAETSALRIEVTGEQFWWRVAYHSDDSERPVSAANEVRLPVGERVEFLLDSTDVIHSFWIPSLGGKMDMIPGRRNRLSLMATKPGTYRAACAEYCGTSHALMAFTAIAMEPGDFRQWLAARAVPSPGAQAAGRDLFLRHGCGACHRVDGTAATGSVGPDLSHVGSRATLGAGVLPNDEEALRSFIAHPQSIKPGSRMPGFSMLPERDIAEIAAWLKGLE